MNEIIFNYIVQSILGGASGYITNDYAINMLFKEYTPLKIGGVIKKTRHEFIENISSMVENDIINKEKLQDILWDESFRKEFENMTADFYENSLYEATGKDTFSNVDGFQKTVESTHIFAAETINQHMPELYEAIAESINIQDFLSSEQLNKISTSLYSTLVEIIHKTDIVENMLLSVLKSNDSIILKNIFDEKVSNKIIVNGVDLLVQAVSESDEEKLAEFLNSVGLCKALHSSFEILTNKNVREVINLDSNALEGINQSLLSYVNSEKGNNLLNSLAHSLFSYGKECNKSIFQLLDSSFEENLKLYLIKNIPSITENVVDWIKLNGHIIDKLIEDSIDEVIRESDGLKAKLLSVIKNTYFSSLSKKYSIVDKIIAYVKKVSEPEKLSRNLSAKIIEILSNLTVKEIITEAEENHINPDNISKFINNYINKNSKSIIENLADYILDIQLKRLFPDGLKNYEMEATIAAKLKEIASSDFAKTYIASKTIKYADNVLSKELSELIDEEKAKYFSVKIKEIIEDKIKSNENPIKMWIEKEAKAAATSYSSIKLNPNAIGQLNEELFRSFNKSTKELRDVNISIALDKLNSIDNLAKNSSESLRTYAVKNADVILSGSIKAIATDNLNKLNDEELVGLANDFIGRELKPIMFFGGILGVLAGLIIAAFQNSALDFSEINAARLLSYALVGYVTNVIAINMVFKPYKENKLLSRLPFFRNFSIGYIVKNQKTFAKNTAHFIDKSLLSKKSINELFEKYRDKIKSSFTNTIADNNYTTLSNLLYNNKKGVAKGIFSFLKTKLSENLSIISAYIFNKISSVKANSLLNKKAVNKLSSLLISAAQNKKISRSIHSILSSPASLESKISGNAVKKYIDRGENICFNKLNTLLSQENELNNLILKNEDKYENFISKTANEILGNSKEKLAHSLAEKTKSIVLSKDSRDKITQKAVGLINKSIDRNKSFEEIFDGKFKNYLDSQVPLLLEKMTSSVVSNIKENKSKISLMVQSEIKNNLGFIEKSMYSLMGGDEIIDELLTKIIMVKVPRFLDDKKLELNSMVNILLQERLYIAKVESLYTGINKLQLNVLVDSYLTENSLQIEGKINTVAEDLLTKAENIKLISVLKPFYAHDLNTFLNKHKEEIDAFVFELNLNMENNRLQVMDRLSAYTDSLTHKFMKKQFTHLFAGISENEINNVQEKIFKELNINNFESIVNESLKSFINHIDANIGEFIDRDEFIKAAEKNLLTLIESYNFEKTLKERVEAVIDEAISMNFSFIDIETKNYFLDLFVDACINSLKNRLNEILKAVEFDKIAQEEIEKMEPEKIHEMFDSFAGKYFKRLMLYGLGGFVFGINVYVGFSLTLLKIISELVKKNKLK